MTHEGSEQTKIVPVICRDCKETMTVLALASAKIIEGRCPGCTKAFNKKQEEYNKSIGYTTEPGKPGTLVYTPEPEQLSDLAMHTLTCNAVFGLEWLLNDEISDRVVRELKDGIQFCDNISETDESKAIKTALQKIVGELQMYVDEHAKAYFKGEKAKEMLDAHLPKYSKQELRKMQHFFNEQGTPYLRRQITLMRRRHSVRGW